MKLADDLKVSDLTVGEFRSLIREIVGDVVQQAIFELEQQLPDPDQGKKFRPEFADQLRNTLDENEPLLTVENIKRELGLDG